MSQALSNYIVLYDSIRSRQRRVERLGSLDRLAARARVWLKARGTGPAALRAAALQVDALAPEMRSMSEAALADATTRLREVFVRARQSPADEERALAIVREHARRETGEEAYIVQLMGAMALSHGRLVQMLTGEGKTLTGSIAAALVAWRHKRIHVFTTNDYLARRDAESRAGIFKRCGLSCAAIQHEQDPAARREVYARPIVYGTSKQITADYLRDQIMLRGAGPAWSARAAMMGLTPPGGAGGSGGGARLLGGDGAQAPAAPPMPIAPREMVPLVPGLRACMVDEADAVLIDEGVVPLIIARSRGQDEMADVYRRAAGVAGVLDIRTDYRVDLLRRKAELTAAGRARIEELTGEFDEPIWRARRRAEELVRMAIVARHCYLKGRQYEVVDGRVVIVDEYTGRFLPDRSWEHGLHQSVEAKENVDVTADRETLARISFQRFYRLYPFMCGMTGTAADATGEMESVYERRVVVIPPNRPVIRAALATRVFRTAAARWKAVADSVEEMHALGRPVLAGTRSIAASELLSQSLAARGLVHTVLNANFDKDEAKIIERAGEAGSIVVATNMAGRGTDIKLNQKARAAGGLHVILSEMHGARRIDLQFIGRSGRQGDPGSAQMFVSLEDELVRLFAKRLAMLLDIGSRGAGLGAKGGGGGDELRGRSRTLALGMFRLAQRLNVMRDRSMREEVARQDEWVHQHLPGE